MLVPEGFAVVSPYILVEKAERYIEFLMAAFGAVEIGRSVADNGRIANSQLRFDTSTIMVSDATKEYPAKAGYFYLFVADADKTMAKAIAAGAVKIMDVADMPYGDRQGGLRDPAGNVWWVAQRLVDEPYF